ncbi:hypothetical protein PG913_04740 [Tenacibaculum pacificus]|uniref:hypothetical protein n=1 Tax=Tenacibaculum pacificus TaxID=3018314 RepID=UPI0022F39148|nr:hypothetical protein [Tenacibaculum pacificus]WBX74505.1 hypothetical protein PG913_04740 [Tenacibaculum pacificus]
MKNIKTIIVVTILIIGFSSCKQKTEKQEVKIKQSFTEHTPTAHHKIALEVLEASKNWIANFNNGNTEACVKGYDEKAIMKVAPFGIKKGITEISEFWIPFAKSGATNLIYTNVSVEIVDEKTAFLAANWSMNIGNGIIFQEKWEKKSGKWILTYDDFKVLEQFKSPKENTTNPVASHLILEDVIKASIEWTNGFNTQKGTICANGYSKDAYLNAIPFASINGKKGIQGFWEKLIKDGATNLTYHNPTFKVTTDNTAFLSSQWSMNIGEGKIYQEKWEKTNNTWLLTYDEFKVLKQY